jgi:hypothetical protein
MKLQGKTIQPPKPLTIPVFRDGKNLGLLAGPVLSFQSFTDMCPKPEPPASYDVKTGTKEQLKEDPAFLKSLDIWADRKTNWMVLTSLSSSPDLVWDTVDMEKPETWKNFREEMESCFSAQEVDIIISCVFDANVPTEKRGEEASDLFTDTSTEMDQEVSESPTEEQNSIPSGEPVSDLESSPQT